MTAETTTAWVEKYYEAGWALVPLPPRRKAAPPPGTTGVGGRDLTREQLREQLTAESNIGLRMPDGVIGIDVDAYDSKVGLETLQFLEDVQNGPLPPSPRLTSRDDGVSGIRFYRVPPGRRWRDPGDDVDMIQRSHRYAVAAPSIHPEGRQYVWFWPGDVIGGVPAVADLPALPEAWVEALSIASVPVSVPGPGPVIEVSEMLRTFLPGPACESVRHWEAEALAAARRERGGAHNALLGPVLALVRMGVAGCPGAGDALLAARAAYVALDEAHDRDFLPMIAGAVPKAVADPWVCAECLTKEIPEQKAEPAPNPLGWVTFDEEFWNPPPPVYFIPGMLIENQVCTIYSAGGLGKSLLAQDIVVGLTLRGRVFGQPVEKQPVLYIDRENSRRGLAKRLRSMGYNGVQIDLLHYSLLGSWPPLDTIAGGKALLAELKRTGARFLVLDTLSKVVDGEENSNDTWKGLHNHTMVAVKQAGVTVLQLDHTGKDAERGQRGGSSKHDNVEVVWHLTATDGFVKLENKKDRDDDYEPVVYLERVQHPRLEHVLSSVLPAEAAIEMEKESMVDELVVMLDGLDVPIAWGRGRAREAMKVGYPDLKFSNEALVAALAKRRPPDQHLTKQAPI